MKPRAKSPRSRSAGAAAASSALAADRPAWFDAGKHVASDVGIMERATGIWLAADGLPLDGPRRAAALLPALDTPVIAEPAATTAAEPDPTTQNEVDA